MSDHQKIMKKNELSGKAAASTTDEVLEQMAVAEQDVLNVAGRAMRGHGVKLEKPVKVGEQLIPEFQFGPIITFGSETNCDTLSEQDGLREFPSEVASNPEGKNVTSAKADALAIDDTVDEDQRARQVPRHVLKEDQDNSVGIMVSTNLFKHGGILDFGTVNSGSFTDNTDSLNTLREFSSSEAWSPKESNGGAKKADTPDTGLKKPKEVEGLDGWTMIDKVKEVTAVVTKSGQVKTVDVCDVGAEALILFNKKATEKFFEEYQDLEIVDKSTPAVVISKLSKLEGCVPLAISQLSRIITSSYTDLQDYTYYFVPAPWLCIKLLRLLQNYPAPENPAIKARLLECLEGILNKAQDPPKSKKVQHSNARNAVLFEAIALIIHMDSEAHLLVRACNQLGTFLSHRDTNFRFLALKSMCLLTTSEISHEVIKKYQETIINSLKTERDDSVRQVAVDLLYVVCDRSNANEIVSEMLSYLESAYYSIKEEMVLKIAILTEKYATDYIWYVDVILKLIRIAGDYVPEEILHRVIQIVVNRADVQGYAAKTVFEALQRPDCHENMVKVGGYVLGEFGNLIAGDQRSSPQIQFELLHSKFHLCSISTRCLLLTTYVKFCNLFPEIKHIIQPVFRTDQHLSDSDAELQRRALEFLSMNQVATSDVSAIILEGMPPFAETESIRLAKLKKTKPQSEDGENVEKDKKTMASAVMAPQSEGGAYPSLVDIENGSEDDDDDSPLLDAFDQPPAVSGSSPTLSVPASDDPETVHKECLMLCCVIL